MQPFEPGTTLLFVLGNLVQGVKLHLSEKRGLRRTKSMKVQEGHSDSGKAVWKELSEDALKDHDCSVSFSSQALLKSILATQIRG